MILQVAALTGGSADRALSGREVRRAVSVVEARDLLAAEPVTVVVLDWAMEGAAGLVQSIRAGEFGEPRLPFVVLSDGPLDDDLPLLPFDGRLRHPVPPSVLESAVDRAEQVSQYRETVDDLFERCRRRAQDGADPMDDDEDLYLLRDRADGLFADLDGDAQTVSALLWAPEEAEPEE